MTDTVTIRPSRGPAFESGEWETVDLMSAPVTDTSSAVELPLPVTHFIPPRTPSLSTMGGWQRPRCWLGSDSHPLSLDNLDQWILDLPQRTPAQPWQFLEKVVAAGKLGDLLLTLEQQFDQTKPRTITAAREALTDLRKQYAVYRGQHSTESQLVFQDTECELQTVFQFLKTAGFVQRDCKSRLSDLLTLKTGNSLGLNLLAYLLAEPYLADKPQLGFLPHSGGRRLTLMFSRPGASSGTRPLIADFSMDAAGKATPFIDAQEDLSSSILKTDAGSSFFFLYYPNPSRDWWQQLGEAAALRFGKFLLTTAPERADFRLQYLKLLFTAAGHALYTDEDPVNSQIYFEEAVALYPKEILSTLDAKDRFMALLTTAQGAMALNQSLSVARKYNALAGATPANALLAKSMVEAELSLRSGDRFGRQQAKEIFDDAYLTVKGTGYDEGIFQHDVALAHFNCRQFGYNHHMGQARLFLDEALKNCPDDLQILQTNIRLLFAENKFEECLDQCEHALNYFPKSRVVEVWRKKAEASLSQAGIHAAYLTPVMVPASAPASTFVIAQKAALRPPLALRKAMQAFAQAGRSPALWTVGSHSLAPLVRRNLAGTITIRQVRP